MRPQTDHKNSSMALAALLFYGILTLWVPGRWAVGIYQSLVLGAAAAWGIWLIVRPAAVQSTSLLVPLAMVPVWGLAQLASGRTIYRWETWNSVLNWTVNLAVFFLALQILSDRPARQRFLNSVLYFGVGLSVISTLQMFTSGGKIFWIFPSGYSDFVLGPFVYKNQYAAFIETILPIALYRGMTSKTPFRYWAMAAVMVASVLAAASRMGAVLVIGELLVIPLVASFRGLLAWRTAAMALGSAIALSGVFTAVVGTEVIWNRFQQADPYQGRDGMLRSSLQMIHDRPGLGFGLGTWSTAYPAYALYDDGSFANQAHNDWAQWAVEGGLPLAGAMFVFACLIGRLAWTSLWGFGLVSVLLHCLVDYPMQQRPALAAWFFALAGTLAAAGAADKPSVRHSRGSVPQ